MDEIIDVRALRGRLGWTQDRMAAELGLDRSSVSRMESGQAPKGPTLIVLRQIAQNAGLSLSDFASPSSPAPHPQTTGGEA